MRFISDVQAPQGVFTIIAKSKAGRAWRQRPKQAYIWLCATMRVYVSSPTMRTRIENACRTTTNKPMHILWLVFMLPRMTLTLEAGSLAFSTKFPRMSFPFPSTLVAFISPFLATAMISDVLST